MSKNSFANAGAALLYIVAVSSLMYYGPKSIGPVDSILIPIGMLSLFVLSAAVMGLLFLYQPAQLFFEGKKDEAIPLFLKTVGVFAGITMVMFTSLFLFA